MTGESTPSDPVAVYDSKPFFAAYGTGMGFAAGAVTMVPGVGWILAIPLAAHSLWALRRLLDRKPRIQVTEEGIVDENFWYSPGLIPWDEILDVRRTRFGLIEVVLRDDAGFWNRLSPLKQLARLKMQMYGLGPALITPWGLKRRNAEVLRSLQEGLDRYVLEAVHEEKRLGGGHSHEEGR